MISLQTAVNVVVSFVVVFTTPYLMKPAYADLGPNLGYLWGGFAILGAVWIWFCMPELKGRNLEEIDELFEKKLPAWQFHKYETTGLSHDVAVIQNAPNTKSAVIELEDVQREAAEKNRSAV